MTSTQQATGSAAIVRRLSRRRALSQAAWGSAALLGALGLRQPGTAAQEATPPALDGEEVGVAPAGQAAFEIVGKIEQRGFNFTLYGYLTHVAGLDPTILFAGPDALDRSAERARLTYFGTAVATARSILDDTLFIINGEGRVTYYYQDVPGASFETPEGFFAGSPIAIAAIPHIQSIINVYAPQQGIFTGSAEVVFEASTQFTHDGQSYRVGRPDLRLRMAATGQGTLLDELLPQSEVLTAGQMIVSDP